MTAAHRWGSPTLRVAVVVLTQALAGCQTPIEAGVSAGAADATISLLHAHHVSATKRPHARINGGESFDVLVLDAELVDAISVLRATASAVTDASSHTSGDEPSWVPTPIDEQLRLATATASRLERTLRLWDGVVDVRVHIAPSGTITRPLGAAGSTPTAVVVIKHHRGRPPNNVEVQTLVAHAVERLRPDDVAVIPIEARMLAPVELTQIGPLAVTAGSADALRTALVGTLSLIAAFAASVLWSWRRLRGEDVNR